MAARKRILVAFPSSWDFRQLEASRSSWEGRYELVWGDPTDDDCRADLEPEDWVARMVAAHGGKIDGVMSSSDYPGSLLSAVLAARMGLPGPAPDRVLRALHKYHCREVQRRVVPEATPGFRLIDPASSLEALAAVTFPVFVKPVKGSFSVHARKVHSRQEMVHFLRRPEISTFLEEYLAIFHRSVRAYSRLEHDGRFFIAEDILRGHQVTVEGYVQHGAVAAPWITDSVFHPGTHSFRRFDHPSILPPRVQDRMRVIAERTIRGLGLDDTMFNIEMMHDPERDTDHIIEVNPRMCGQFADFYQKVHGSDGYGVALAIAAGDPVTVRSGAGRHACASSNPLRIFEPSRFERVPSARTVHEIERLHDGCLVWVEASAGQVMDDFTSGEDGQSARYAIINLGSDSAADRDRRMADILARLDFGIAPLTAAGGRATRG